jgi:hypothetical protein
MHLGSPPSCVSGRSSEHFAPPHFLHGQGDKRVRPGRPLGGVVEAKRDEASARRCATGRAHQEYSKSMHEGEWREGTRETTRGGW